MDAGGRSHSGDVLGEGHRRQIDQVRALEEADGPPGSPMDGDGTIWVNAPDRLGRLLGVKVPLTKGGSPASDWSQGDIDARHLLERKVRTRVARIPAPAGASNKIAECGSSMRAPRVSPAVVVGGQYTDREAAEIHRVTRLDLVKLQTAGGHWLEQAARACWGDENRGGWDQSERG
jgi:hypothetical protein